MMRPRNGFREKESGNTDRTALYSRSSHFFAAPRNSECKGRTTATVTGSTATGHTTGGAPTNTIGAAQNGYDAYLNATAALTTPNAKGYKTTRATEVTNRGKSCGP